MLSRRLRDAVVASLLVVLPRIALAQDSTAGVPPATPTPGVGSMDIQLNGFLQVWYLDGHTLTNAHDTYRVRRADVKLSGALSPRIRWRFSIDGAKLLNLSRTVSGSGDTAVVRDVSVDQRGRILQEASINLTLGPRMRIDLGQQIIPLALEGVIPSAQIETIERTMFIAERTRGAGLGDIRDIGASLRGTLARGMVDYHVGLYNEMGTSQNTTDQNDQKATLGRIAIRVPGVKGFQVGGSGGYEGGSDPEQRHQRVGGEAQFRRSLLTLRSEVMTARDGTDRRIGWYGLGAVRVAPNVQLVGRWDDWDPDVDDEASATTVRERQIVVGANYFIDGDATRVAANIIHASFPSGRVGASNLLLLSLQVAW